MSQNCPDCATEMYEADDMNCEKANWICPECAPEFVLKYGTTSGPQPEEGLYDD